MILYKYMTDSAARAVLSSGTIGFAKSDTFNDPFELQAGYPTEGNNPLEIMFNNVRAWGKRFIWSENSGILCLTRNPVNPLMWAHYGDKHRGVVVGIDVDRAGFCEMSSCLIPAQFGNVIYTHTRPNHPLLPVNGRDPISVGHTHDYPTGHEEKLQRLFLQKPACWSYEEEVRVVKCIADRDENGKNQSGKFSELTLHTKTLYCYELPKGSIREVYFGLRHPGIDTIENANKQIQEYRELYEGISIMGCGLSKETWDIQAFDLSSVVTQMAANK